MLERIEDDAEQLAASVHTTAEVSERVSRKIRELDMAQSHIHDTLARIHIVVDRTQAIDGVKQVHEQAPGFLLAQAAATGSGRKRPWLAGRQAAVVILAL